MTGPIDEGQMAVQLPSGYHCAVTWGIPDNYGGMTDALLHRSRSFLQEARQPVDVLTFEYRSDYEAVRNRLMGSGELVDGLLLRNLWEELPRLGRRKLLTAKQSSPLIGGFAPLEEGDEFDEELLGQPLWRRIRYDSRHEKVLQVDYLRPDGTVVVSDLRDADKQGVESGRLVTLCDEKGRPVVTWKQIWPLYLFWLDTVVSGREAYMIVDSKSAANFMTRYRRPNVVTMHLVHNSHLASGASPSSGRLSQARRYVFERLSTFDAVVLLTERQKQDVDLISGSLANTCAIPNSRTPPVTDPTAMIHRTAHGVLLASLTKRKRLEDAVSAVVKANAISSSTYNLTIYGEGPEMESLRGFVTDIGASHFVRLAGFQSDARQAFQTASFTLLTSRVEGQGLVLLEAMSYGCIPIAYDIPYGPSDIIRNGQNGYLVEEGDIEAMARRIVSLNKMSEQEASELRQRAVDRSKDFSDRSVVSRWGDEMAAAVHRKLMNS